MPASLSRRPDALPANLTPVKTTNLIAPLALAAALAGCANPQNDRITIGRTQRLEAFTPSPMPGLDQTPGPGEQVQAPSLTGIDRGNWEKTSILLPVDGTAHYPLYHKRVVIADKTRRQQNRQPTALSALDLYNGSESDQELEALANIGITAADFALLPIRVVWTPPWRTRWSPDEAYQRYWYPERNEPEPALNPGEPYSQPEPQKVTP